MEKTCFVIMPISTPDGYTDGHFKRVYEHIIKKACLNAGFTPLRADDVLNTNLIALDIIKNIISCDMAICDLSSKNPNVLYELGIRQAFNLPVTLIRDTITERVFDIQGFRDIEYDETLRIDNVENAINIISETLSNTFNSKGKEINSLVSLLGIHAAQVSSNIEISNETELILNALNNFGSQLNRLEKISLPPTAPMASFSIDEKGHFWKELDSQGLKELALDDIVEHSKFGLGRVTKLEGQAHNPIATLLFQHNGEKKVMLNYVRLKKLFKIE